MFGVISARLCTERVPFWTLREVLQSVSHCLAPMRVPSERSREECQRGVLDVRAIEGGTCQGWTALMWASQVGNAEDVKLLLASGPWTPSERDGSLEITLRGPPTVSSSKQRAPSLGTLPLKTAETCAWALAIWVSGSPPEPSMGWVAERVDTGHQRNWYPPHVEQGLWSRRGLPHSPCTTHHTTRGRSRQGR